MPTSNIERDSTGSEHCKNMTLRPTYAAISQHASFKHERLQLSENSIRLFQVQRASKNEPISLRMTQFSSLRRPSYKAISYTWGDSANTHRVLINGQLFLIHLNLWNLLFHLRQRGETSFLWADALCIDQANLRERNFHVRLMGKIYEQASSVVVWLGLPSADRTEIRAMDFIKEIAWYRKNNSDAAFANTYLVTDLEHRWQTLLRMCRHKYWTRQWIIQEFLQASAVELLCGTSSLNWQDFEALASLLLQDSNFLNHVTISHLVQSRPIRLTARRRSGSPSNLYELLRDYSDSECTERRDKVYGILGLATDCALDEVTGISRGVQPDYNKHVVEVYLDAVSCIANSLPSKALIPSVAYLVSKTLLLTYDDVMDYMQLAQKEPSRPQPMTATFEVLPTYVGLVQRVLPSWTSIRDLKQRLDALDWGEHVGYEVQSRPSIKGRRSSSRTVHSAIPDDMVQNILHVANNLAELAMLHNYPTTHDFVLPSEHVLLHPEDKRLYNNPSLQKPSLIIEQPSSSEKLRLGFACTDVQRGDLVLQFRGLDFTLVGRQIGHHLNLVGKAVMIKHSGIVHENVLDPICQDSDWLSHCPSNTNTDMIQFESDPLSLMELLSR